MSVLAGLKQPLADRETWGPRKLAVLEVYESETLPRPHPHAWCLNTWFPAGGAFFRELWNLWEVVSLWGGLRFSGLGPLVFALCFLAEEAM